MKSTVRGDLRQQGAGCLLPVLAYGGIWTVGHDEPERDPKHSPRAEGREDPGLVLLDRECR
jgi:hypothetical protein